MTILELLQKTTSYFEKAGVPSPRLDTELLLAHVLQLKRMELYLQFERVLTNPELDALRPLVKRRAAREPLQYILGSVEFGELILEVTQDVLVPRPETEILCEKAVEWGKARATPPQGILDVGTGSGAIILWMARAFSSSRCVATDLSDRALSVARRNAAANFPDSNPVEFRLGGLFSPMVEGERFDIILSNPPYIPTGEIPSLQQEVRHEPASALDGGDDGLDLVRGIIQGSLPLLTPGGLLMMEIGHNQAPAVKKLLENARFEKVAFHRDLQGIERIASAQLPC